MAAMACTPTLMRAAMSELPVLHRSCTVPVNSAEHTMERTNSNDLMLMDYLSRTTSGLQQALSRTNSGEALNVTKNDTSATVPTHKRKRSLTINTSPGNFFQRCLQSPGEKSPSALKLSPTLPTLPGYRRRYRHCQERHLKTRSSVPFLLMCWMCRQILAPETQCPNHLP